MKEEQVHDIESKRTKKSNDIHEFDSKRTEKRNIVKTFVNLMANTKERKICKQIKYLFLICEFVC